MFRLYSAALRIRRDLLAACLLLATQAGLLAWSAYIHSPTPDEIAYMPAGISHWQFGRFELYRANPPLVRMVAVLPVLAAGYKTDWTQFDGTPGQRTEFYVGKDFLTANGFRSFWLFTIARWACIPFVLLGGVVCWRWADELYGPTSGLAALSLWCFCPNVLGNGALITPDAATSSLGIGVSYVFWKWLKSPNWTVVWRAGLVLGFAELAKTNWLILFPLFPAIWLVWRFFPSSGERARLGERGTWHQLAQLMTVFALAVLVINLGYGFDGTFKQLGQFQFTSRILRGNIEHPDHDNSQAVLENRFRNTPLASLPMPLPEQYVIGIDVQKHAVERGRMAYLFGVWKFHGWWYYYLAAAMVKVPVGIWVLLAMTIAVRLARVGWTSRRPTMVGVSPASVTATFRDELVLLLPAIATLVFISSQTGINRHFRYALPIFPFLYVWLSSLVLLVPSPLMEERSSVKAIFRRRNLPAALATLAFLSAITHSLWVYPHSLSYFNEVAGGPRGGPRFLLDSNTDWGQDLLLIKKWIDEHPDATPLYVAWSDHSVARDAAGIAAPPPPHLTAPGWHIVSVNAQHTPHGRLDDYRHHSPIAFIGGSTVVFKVSARPNELQSE
jgi:hypothetical protein